MVKQNPKFVLIATLLLLGRIGAVQNIHKLVHPLKMTSESNIAVHVSNITYDCATGIRFNWRIENISPEVVYVYSPFLGGRAAGPLEYNRAKSTLLIPTSAKKEVSFPPYSYPEATFEQLVSRGTIKGSFFEPISSELSCRSRRPKKLVFQVAWGREITQLTMEIARIKKEGRVHPANPIMHWANLATSEPTAIHYIDK